MKLLVIGGSGRVASMVMPTLQSKHDVRVFDLKAPQDASIDHRIGSVSDPEALQEAMQGVDAVLYMAMGSEAWETWQGVDSAFEANVKGLYFVLKIAAEAGVRQAVYTSSMSVYADLMQRYFPDEGITPDETGLYGFTKKLGEDVCQNACRAWGMNISALRLCHPTPKDDWLELVKDGQATIATEASDVGRAMLAGLEYEGGFQTFMISGDFGKRYMDMSKAKRLLGWEPQARPDGG